jgi:hypothetical protein
MLDRLSSLRA